ncbi:MAG: AraC family transcriptional regulator [Treponema sp.]|jgi:AraC-like DNA-binding protein|nr:AraC family transcriptional regulator [Treponema sp.]
MDNKPWYQKLKFETSFSFYLLDITFQNYTFHWHELVELVYVLKGEISISVEGKTYESKEGDIVVVNPGSIHGFYDAGAETSLCIYQIGLDIFGEAMTDLRDQELTMLIFNRKPFFSFKEGGSVYQRLKELLLGIRKEYIEKKEGYHLAIKAGLYELALLFLREIPSQIEHPHDVERRNSNHQILERLFSYIHENSANPNITLEKAAEVAALSKFYFTRFFKERTGQTFHAYLSRVRINQAQECLVESDKAITDIAYLCGFSSLKTFNRLFKSYVGTSPSNYRAGKSVRNPGQFLRQIQQ